MATGPAGTVAMFATSESHYCSSRRGRRTICRTDPKSDIGMTKMTDPMTDYAEFCYISGLLGRIKELEQQHDAAVAILLEALSGPPANNVHRALAALEADTKEKTNGLYQGARCAAGTSRDKLPYSQ